MGPKGTVVLLVPSRQYNPGGHNFVAVINPCPSQI